MLQNENTEWRLSPIVFQSILEVFSCKPETDIFASCIHYQIDWYVSWHPDSNAIAIDAFTISWSELNFYAFAPISLIGAATAKVRQERCSAIMTIPWWKTRFWFPMLVSLLTNFPILLPPNILTLPSARSPKHPLCLKKTIGRSLIRESFRKLNLPREITNVITNSWRTTNRIQYESVLRQWFVYAASRIMDPCTPDVNTILLFTLVMYINGCLYSGLCSTRSALSSIVTIKGYKKLSEHPFISRYLIDTHPCLNNLVSGTYHLY